MRELITQTTGLLVVCLVILLIVRLPDLVQGNWRLHEVPQVGKAVATSEGSAE